MVLEEGRATGTGLEGVVRVAQPGARRRGEEGSLLAHVGALRGQRLAGRGHRVRRVLLWLRWQRCVGRLRLQEWNEVVAGCARRGRWAGGIVCAHTPPLPRERG